MHQGAGPKRPSARRELFKNLSELFLSSILDLLVHMLWAAFPLSIFIRRYIHFPLSRLNSEGLWKRFVFVRQFCLSVGQPGITAFGVVLFLQSSGPFV